VENLFQYGIALSGGGAKAIAHLGVLKFLAENNIVPQVVAGTSMGAIVGLFHCAGFSPNETLKIFIDIRKYFFKSYAINKPGMIDLEKIAPILREFIPQTTFDALQYKLIVTSTDLLKPEAVIFTKGDPLLCALSSSSFPFVFSPIAINGQLLSDGGIYNNFPVNLVRNSCTYLIGSLVLNVHSVTKEMLKSTTEVAHRAFSVALNNKLTEQLKDCDFAINPKELENYNMFVPESKKLNEIFKIGYNEAQKQFEKTIIKNNTDWRNNTVQSSPTGLFLIFLFVQQAG